MAAGSAADSFEKEETKAVLLAAPAEQRLQPWKKDQPTGEENPRPAALRKRASVAHSHRCRYESDAIEGEESSIPKQLAFCDALVGLLFLLAATGRCMPSPHRCHAAQHAAATEQGKDAVTGTAADGASLPGAAVSAAAHSDKRPETLSIDAALSAPLNAGTPGCISSTVVKVGNPLTAAPCSAVETGNGVAADEATHSNAAGAGHRTRDAFTGYAGGDNAVASLARASDDSATTGSKTSHQKHGSDVLSMECADESNEIRTAAALLLLSLQLLFDPASEGTTSEVGKTVSAVIPPVDKELIRRAPFFAFLLVLISVNPRTVHKKNNFPKPSYPAQNGREQKPLHKSRPPTRLSNMSQESCPQAAAETTSAGQMQGDAASGRAAFSSSVSPPAVLHVNSPGHPIASPGPGGCVAGCPAPSDSISSAMCCSVCADLTASSPEVTVASAAASTAPPCVYTSQSKAGAPSLDVTACNAVHTHESARLETTTVLPADAEAAEGCRSDTGSSVFPQTPCCCGISSDHTFCCHTSLCHTSCRCADQLFSCNSVECCVNPCSIASLCARVRCKHSQSRTGSCASEFVESNQPTVKWSQSAPRGSPEETTAAGWKFDAASTQSGATELLSAKLQGDNVAFEMGELPAKEPLLDSHPRRRDPGTFGASRIAPESDTSAPKTLLSTTLASVGSTQPKRLPTPPGVDATSASYSCVADGTTDEIALHRSSGACPPGDATSVGSSVSPKATAHTSSPTAFNSSSAYPTALSAAASAVKPLALILEHVSHSSGVQPLLLVLLPPTLHLLLQIFPQFVHNFVYPSLQAPPPQVELLSSDILALLTREIDQLLSRFQLDLNCCCCKWHRKENRGRPLHLCPRQQQRQQDQHVSQQVKRTVSASKQVSHEDETPQRTIPHVCNGQPQYAEHPLALQQQAQKHKTIDSQRRESSDHYPSLHISSRGKPECTASSGTTFWVDSPTKTAKPKTSQFCSCHACGSCTSCGMSGASADQQVLHCCQKEQHARDYASTATSGSGANEASASCKHCYKWSGSTSTATQRGAHSRAVPAHATSNGNCSSGNGSESTSQSSMKENARYRRHAFLTCSQRDNLESGMRRLLHFVQTVKRHQRALSEQPTKEHSIIRFPSLSGSPANTIRERVFVLGESPPTNSFLYFSTIISSASGSCGKAVIKATSESHCDPASSGVPVSERCGGPDALICNAATSATAHTNACVSPSGTTPVAPASHVSPSRCPQEGSPLESAKETKRQRDCVQNYCHFSENGSTVQVPATDAVNDRLHREPWSPTQQTPENSLLEMGAPMLILLEAGALMPFHPHTLLTYALRQRRERRWQQLRGQQSRETPEQRTVAMCSGGLIDDRGTKLRETDEGVTAVEWMRTAGTPVRQSHQQETSADGGMPAFGVPDVELDIYQCTPPNEESGPGRRRFRRGFPLPRSFFNIQPWLWNLPETEGRGTQSAIPHQSEPSVTTVGVVFPAASSTSAAACAVPDTPLSVVEKRDPPTVCNDADSSIEFRESISAAPCAAPAGADLENGAASFESLSSAAPAATLLAPDDTSSGITPLSTPTSVCWSEKSSGVSSVIVFPPPSARGEQRQPPQIQQQVQHAVQTVEKSELKRPVPRRDSQSFEPHSQFTTETRCAASPLNSTESFLSPSASVTAASTPTDSLTSNSGQALDTMLREDAKLRTRPSASDVVCAAQVPDIHKQRVTPALAGEDAPAAHGIALTSKPTPALLTVSLVVSEAEKSQRLSAGQGPTRAGVPTLGASPTTFQLRDDWDTTVPLDEVAPEAAPNLSTVETNKHLKERPCSTPDGAAFTETHEVKIKPTATEAVVKQLPHTGFPPFPVAPHATVTSTTCSGMAETLKDDHTSHLAETPDVVADAMDVACDERRIFKRSASEEHRSSVFSTPPQSSAEQLQAAAAFPAATVVGTNRRASTPCSTAASPALIEKPRRSFVSLRPPAAYYRSWQPLLSLLGKKVGRRQRSSTESSCTKSSAGNCGGNADTSTTGKTVTSIDNVAERASVARAAKVRSRDTDKEAVPLQTGSACARAPGERISSSLEDICDTEVSLPLLWPPESREVEQQRVLRRLSFDAQHQAPAGTCAASSPAALTPFSLSDFSTSHLLEGEQKSCIIGTLTPATDPEGTALQQSKKVEIPASSGAPQVNDRIPALRVEPQVYMRRSFEGETYNTDDVYRHTSTWTAACKCSSPGCNVIGRRSRARGTYRFSSVRSRNNSPPLFFSVPEVTLPYFSSEDSLRTPEVQSCQESNRRLENSRIDRTTLENSSAPQQADLRSHHTAKAHGSQRERRVRGGRAAGTTRGAPKSRTDRCDRTKQIRTEEPVVIRQGSKTADRDICVRAEQLVHRLYQTCLEVAQLTKEIRAPCRLCARRHGLVESCVAPLTTVSALPESPATSGNLRSAVGPEACASTSPDGGSSVALPTLVKDSVPAVSARLLSPDVSSCAAASETFGASASLLPSLLNPTRTPAVQAHSDVSRPSPALLAEDMQNRDSAENRTISPSGAQQRDEVLGISPEGLLLHSGDRVSSEACAGKVQAFSVALREVVRAKPLQRLAKSLTEAVPLRTSENAGPTVESFLDIEERALQELQQTQRGQMCCCPDRSLLCQQRTVSYRTLRTVLHALYELVSQQCSRMTLNHSGVCTHTAEALSFAPRDTQIATSKSLLCLLLRSPLTVHLLPHAVCITRSSREGNHSLRRFNRVAKIVQWRQQPHHTGEPRGVFSRSSGNGKLRSRITCSRRKSIFRATARVDMRVHSKRGTNCWADSGTPRTCGIFVLNLCAMLLNALCCAVAPVSTSSCPYRAGLGTAVCSSHEPDVLRRMLANEELTVCRAGNDRRESLDGEIVCKNERSRTAGRRSTKSPYANYQSRRGGGQASPWSPCTDAAELRQVERGAISTAENHLWSPLLFTPADRIVSSHHPMPDADEIRSLPQTAPAYRKLLSETAQHTVPASWTGEEVYVIDGVLPKIAATQLAATPCSEQRSPLNLERLHRTDNGCTAQNECSDRSRNTAAAASLAVEGRPLPGAAECKARIAVQSSCVNRVVFPGSSVGAVDAAQRHTTLQLHSAAEFLADILLDACVPLAYMPHVLRLLRPHRHVILFPYFLRRALCGVLTRCSCARTGASTTSPARSFPARTLAMSPPESLGTTVSCGTKECQRFSFRQPTPSILPAVTEVQALFPRGWLVPSPRTGYGVMNLETRSPVGSAASPVLHKANSVSFLCDTDDELFFSVRSRNVLHSQGLTGTTLSQRDALQLHNITDNPGPAAVDANLHEPHLSPSWPSTWRECSTLEQMPSNLDQLNVCRSERGILCVHTVVDFSVSPWTACLNSAGAATYRTSPTLSCFFTRPSEDLFSAIEEAAGAGLAATCRSADVSCVAGATQPVFLCKGGAATTELALACASWEAAERIRSADVSGFSCATSSRTAFHTAVPLSSPSACGVFANSLPERSLRRHETCCPSMHSKLLDASESWASERKAPELLLLQVPLLLNKFKVSRWLTALEKQQQQHRITREDKFFLLAQVAADLLMHTLQRGRTLVEQPSSHRTQQNAAQRTLLSPASRPLLAATTVDSVMSGMPAVLPSVPSASTGVHPLTLPITTASIACRAAAVPLLFESTTHSSGDAEAIYDLAACTIARCLTRPLLVAGGQQSVSRTFVNRTEERKSPGQQRASDGCFVKTLVREQNGGYPSPIVTTAGSANVTFAKTLIESAPRHVRTSLAKDYTRQRRRQRNSGASGTDVENDTERGRQMFEGREPQEGTSCCVNTCCIRVSEPRVLYGGTARWVSQRLLLVYVERLPELLPALLPVVLFCTPVHLFHPHFPWQLLRLLFLYVKRKQCVSTRAARAFAAEGGTTPCFASSFDTPGFLGRGNFSTTGEWSRPAASAPAPSTNQAAVASLASAALYPDYPSAVPVAQPYKLDIPSGVALGIDKPMLRQHQQCTGTKLGEQARVAQDHRKRFFAGVAKGGCHCQSCREFPLLHCMPPVSSKTSYEEASMSLQKSSLLLLRRLAALLPSFFVSNRCSRTSCCRDDNNIQRYFSCKRAEWTQVRQPLRAAQTLLKKGRVAKRMLHIRTACALFRILLLKAVEVVLNGKYNGGQVRRSGHVAAGWSKNAPRAGTLSETKHFTAERVTECNRRRGHNSSKIETLDGEETVFRKDCSLPENVEQAAVTPSILDYRAEAYKATSSSDNTTKKAQCSCVSVAGATLPVIATRVSAAPSGSKITMPTAKVAATTDRETGSMFPVKKSLEPLSSKKVPLCTEAIEGMAASLVSQLRRILSSLLVRATVYAAAHWTSCSMHGFYQRRYHFMVNLVPKNNAKSRKATGLPRRSLASSGVSSSTSNHNGELRVGHKVPALKIHSFRRYTGCVGMQAGIVRSPLERLMRQRRRRLVSSTLERCSHKNREALHRTTLRSFQTSKQRPNHCVEMQGKQTATLQQQLKSALVVSVGKSQAKSWTRQVAKLIQVSGEACAYDWTAEETTNQSTGRSERGRTCLQRKKLQQDELTSVDRTKGCYTANAQKAFDTSRKSMHVSRECSAKTERKKSACERSLLPTSASGVRRQRLVQNIMRRERAHERQRTFHAGWHLLQSCLQAVKLLPSEKHQTLVVCRALCCLSKDPKSKSNTDSTREVDLLSSYLSTKGNSKDRQERGKCGANLRWPFNEGGKSVTSPAAVKDRLTQDAPTSTARSVTTETDAVSGSMNVTGERNLENPPTSAHSTGLALDYVRKMKAAIITGISSRTSTAPAKAPVVDGQLVARASTKTALQVQSAIATDYEILSMRGSSTEESTVGITGCQRSATPLSGAKSRTSETDVTLGVQRRRTKKKTASEELKDGYSEAICKDDALVKDTIPVGSQDTGTGSHFLQYRSKAWKGRRAMLRCELLLAAVNQQYQLKQKGHLICDGSYSSRNLPQQMRHVYSNEGEVLVERCRAAARLLLLCATTLLPTQYTAVVKDSSTVKWERHNGNIMRETAESSPRGTGDSPRPKYASELLQRDTHSTEKTTTRNVEAWKAKLERVYKERNYKLRKSPVGREGSSEDCTAQTQPMCQSDGGNTHCTKAKSQGNQYSEENQRVFPAWMWDLEDASCSKASETNHSPCPVQEETPLCADPLERRAWGKRKRQHTRTDTEMTHQRAAVPFCAHVSRWPQENIYRFVSETLLLLQQHWLSWNTCTRSVRSQGGAHTDSKEARQMKSKRNASCLETETHVVSGTRFEDPNVGCALRSRFFSDEWETIAGDAAELTSVPASLVVNRIPSKMLAASIRAVLRMAIASYRTAVAATSHSVDRLGAVTCTPRKSSLNRLAGIHIDTSFGNPVNACASKMHGSPQQLFGSAVLSEYVSRAEEGARSGKSCTTAGGVIRTALTTGTVEMMLGYPQEISVPLFETNSTCTSDLSERDATGTFRKHSSHPSSSSVFCLSSSSSSLFDTPRGPDKSALTVLSSERAVHMGFETISQACHIGTGSSPVDSACAKDLLWTDTTQTTQVKTNFFTGNTAPLQLQPRGVCPRNARSLRAGQQERGGSQHLQRNVSHQALHQEMPSPVLRVSKQRNRSKSLPGDHATTDHAVPLLTHLCTDVSGASVLTRAHYQLSPDVTAPGTSPQSPRYGGGLPHRPCRQLLPSHSGHKQHGGGDGRTTNSFTQARTSELVFTALPLPNHRMHSTQQATTALSAVHLHAMRVLLMLLKALSYTHRMEKSFGDRDHLKDDMCPTPDSICGVRLGTCGRGRRVAESERSGARAIANHSDTRRRQSDNRFSWKNVAPSHGHRTTFNSKHHKRPATTLQALTSKRFGSPAFIISSEECRTVMQKVMEAKQLPEKVVFPVWTQKVFSGDRRYTTANTGTCRDSRVPGECAKGGAVALVTHTPPTHVKDLITHVGAGQTLFQIHEVACTQNRADVCSGGNAVEKRTVYSFASAEHRLALTSNPMQVGVSGEFSLTLFRNKNNDPEMPEDRLIIGSEGLNGFGCTHRPPSTVSLFEQQLYLPRCGEPQDTLLAGLSLETCYLVNVLQHAFILQGPQNQVDPAPHTGLQPHVAVEHPTQVSHPREKVEIFKSYPGLRRCQSAVTPSCICASVEVCKDGRDVFERLAAPKVLLCPTDHRDVSSALKETVLSPQKSTSSLREKQDAVLSGTDLCGYRRKDTHNAHRYEEAARGEQGQLREEPWKSLHPLVHQQLSEVAVLEGDASKVQLAGLQNSPHTIYELLLSLARLSDKTTCQEVVTLHSAAPKTIAPTGSTERCDGAPGFTPFRVIRKVRTFQGLTAGRETRRMSARKHTNLAFYTNSQWRFSRPRYLLSPTFYRKSEWRFSRMRQLLTAPFQGVSSRATLVTELTFPHSRRNTLRLELHLEGLLQMLGHEDKAYVAKSMWRAAVAKGKRRREKNSLGPALEGNHNSTRRSPWNDVQSSVNPAQLDDEEPACKKSPNCSDFEVVRGGTGLTATGAVCETSSYAGRSCDVGKPDAALPQLEHAKDVHQVEMPLYLLGKDTSELKTLTEVALSVFYKGSTMSAEEYAGLLPNALVDHVIKSFAFREALHYDDPKSRNRQTTTQNGGPPGRHQTSASLTSKGATFPADVHHDETESQRLNILADILTRPTNIHQRLSRGRVRAAYTEGDVHVDVVQQHRRAEANAEAVPATLEALFYLWCTAPQILLDRSKVTDSHPRVTTDAARHRVPSGTENYLLHVSPSGETQVVEGVASSSDLLLCEAKGNDGRHDQVVNSNSHASLPTTGGRSGHSEDRTWREIESAVHSLHRFEVEGDYRCCECSQKCEGHSYTLAKGHEHLKHLCRNCRTNCSPRIRCVSTLFDSKPSPVANCSKPSPVANCSKPSPVVNCRHSNMSYLSREQRTRLHVDTNKVFFQTTSGAPPQSFDSLVMLQHLKRGRSSHIGATFLGLAFFTCRAVGGRKAVFLRRGGRALSESTQVGGRRRVSGFSAPRTTTGRPPRLTRTTRIWAAVVWECDLCNVRVSRRPKVKLRSKRLRHPWKARCLASQCRRRVKMRNRMCP